MSNSYKEYFENKDYKEALAHFLYEIKENRISKEAVSLITEQLVNDNRIPKSSEFMKKKKSQWNNDYVTYLMSGGAAGKLSKEYIIYFADVSRYVKNKSKKVLLVTIILVLIIILVASFMLGNKQLF